THVRTRVSGVDDRHARRATDEDRGHRSIAPNRSRPPEGCNVPAYPEVKRPSDTNENRCAEQTSRAEVAVGTATRNRGTCGQRGVEGRAIGDLVGGEARPRNDEQGAHESRPQTELHDATIGLGALYWHLVVRRAQGYILEASRVAIVALPARRSLRRMRS